LSQYNITELNHFDLQDHSVIKNKVETLNKSLKRNNSRNETVEFYVNTEYAKYVETSDQSSHSYTFPVNTVPESDLLINFTATLQENGNYEHSFIYYNLNEEERKNVSDGIEVDFTDKMHIATVREFYTIVEEAQINLRSNVDFWTHLFYLFNQITTPACTSVSWVGEDIDSFVFGTCTSGGGGNSSGGGSSSPGGSSGFPTGGGGFPTGGGSSTTGGNNPPTGGGSTTTNDPVVVTSPVTPLQIIANELLVNLKGWLSPAQVAWIKSTQIQEKAALYVYLEGQNNSNTSKNTTKKIIDILRGTSNTNVLTTLEENNAFSQIIGNSLTLLNKNLFPEHAEAFSSLDPNGVLNVDDWRTISPRIENLYKTAEAYEGIKDFEDINQLSPELIDLINKNSLYATYLPDLKALVGDHWPQNREEWEAVLKIMGQSMLEIGLAFVPGSGVIDAISSVNQGNYGMAAFALATVVADFFGGSIIKVIAKIGKVAYKSFKIFRLAYSFIHSLKATLNKGYTITLTSLERLKLTRNDRLIALGDDVKNISRHITAELPRAGTRGGVTVERLSQFRNLPGRALGNGKNVPGTWLRGSEGQAGFFPKSIADKMRDINYPNFNEFRNDFWKNVADDSHLSSQFSSQNLTRMRDGLSPRVRSTQNLGGQTTYQIHHNTPINQGGDVYNFDNLTIVTPRYHKDILLPDYHMGYGY